MLVLVSLLCVLVCVFAQWWVRRSRMLRLAAKVPTFPGGWPLIGHASLVIWADSAQLFEVIKEISVDANKNDGITTVWLQMTPHFVITDPKDAMTALSKCLQKNYIYDFFRPWLGDGIFTAKLPIWLQHRRMLNPAFSPQVLSTFQNIFNRQARKLALALGENAGTGPFNANKLIGQNFLESVYETALGVPAEGTVDKKYAEASNRMLEIVINRFMNSFLHLNCLFRWSKLKTEQDKLLTILHKYSSEVIEKRKSDFNNNEPTADKFKPFLQLLLDLAGTKNAFTEKEVREEVDTMILAGHDTSSIVFEYILIMLGSYPEVQDRVYEEIYDIFGVSDRDVVKDDLKRMVYTEAVINETIRLYPIGCMVPREVMEDVELTKHTLPAGSTVFVSFWGIHRGPHWGPDAEEFKPQRWLDPATLPAEPGAFGGFSLGKRMCIGKAYAMMSIKTSLAHVLRRCRVSADHSKLRLKLDVMLRPMSGNQITVERR